MKEDLRIRVYMNETSDRPILERCLRLDPSVHVPYSELMRDFRFLFGDKCIVMFNYY